MKLNLSPIVGRAVTKTDTPTHAPAEQKPTQRSGWSFPGFSSHGPALRTSTGSTPRSDRSSTLSKLSSFFSSNRTSNPSSFSTSTTSPSLTPTNSFPYTPNASPMGTPNLSLQRISEDGDEALSQHAGPPGDGWGMTFLHAVEQRRTDLLRITEDGVCPPAELDKLLSQTTDLELRDEHGQTPLMRASNGGHPEVVLALIRHGADVNATDAMGNMPLHLLTAASDHRDVQEALQALISHGADVHARNEAGFTPLFNAASDDAVRLLLGAGARIDDTDAFGNSPLMSAAQGGKGMAMMELLKAGADTGQENHAGATFADLVRSHYGLPHDEPVPPDPPTAARFIAFQELLRTPAFRVAPPPAPAASAVTRHSINSLPSGQKINLVKMPDRQADHLDPAEIGGLSEALGFGAAANDPLDLHRQHLAVKNTLNKLRDDLQTDFVGYDNAVLADERLFPGLSEAEKNELTKAMEVAHMHVEAVRHRNGSFVQPFKMNVIFGGTQNLRDVKQDAATAFGAVGKVMVATKRVGELFAKQMAATDNVQFNHIVGASMGGGTAQVFLASLESRVELKAQPSMLLLDPQLLNNKQAAYAVKGGTRPVDFTRPRGVAISLDYKDAPHRGLMGIMKGPGGYRYPGLVHLKLGLTAQDGPNNSPPKTSGPPGLGYHTDFDQFVKAVGRFTGAPPA